MVGFYNRGISWIAAPVNDWKLFIANGVAHIQEASHGGHWRHIPGENNPADVLSRGSIPNELISNELWWFDPKLLILNKTQWPTNIVCTTLDNAPERKQEKMNILISTTPYERLTLPI